MCGKIKECFLRYLSADFWTDYRRCAVQNPSPFFKKNFKFFFFDKLFKRKTVRPRTWMVLLLYVLLPCPLLFLKPKLSNDLNIAPQTNNTYDNYIGE